MNSQWLTMLMSKGMSKGIELEQNLRQQFQQTKVRLQSELETRGIRLNAADFAALLEEVSPKFSHAALSYALDKIRPFSAGMGLRISHLSDFQIEIILPSRTRNLSETHVMHEGAIITAAVEAAKNLWMRHAFMGQLEISVDRIEATFLKSNLGDFRLRMELPETHRELVLSELRDTRKSSSDCEIKVFDENEQTIGEVRLHLKFKHTPALN